MNDQRLHAGDLDAAMETAASLIVDQAALIRRLEQSLALAAPITQEEEQRGLLVSPWFYYGGLCSLCVWAAFYWVVTQ